MIFRKARATYHILVLVLQSSFKNQTWYIEKLLISSGNCEFDFITQHRICMYIILNIFIYTIKVETFFSPRLGPPYPSQRTHLSCPEVWRKGVETYFLIEGKCFYPKANTFFTNNFTIPILYFPLFLQHAINFFGNTMVNTRW